MYLYSFLTVASIVLVSTSKYMQFNYTLYVYYFLEDQPKNRHIVSKDLTDKRVVKNRIRILSRLKWFKQLIEQSSKVLSLSSFVHRSSLNVVNPGTL